MVIEKIGELMRNKKAFTLVELLSILVVLGLIVLVTFPNIITSIQKTTGKEYKRFLKDVELVAERYVEGNMDKLNLEEPGDVEFIELGEMVDAGYLNKKLINPKTEKAIDLRTTVLVAVLNDYTKSYEYTGTVASINNYAASQLKVMYDGYKKPIVDGDKFVWKDVIGNIDGELKNFSSIDDWNNNRIKLDGGNKYINALGSSSVISSSSEVTIEIVYEIMQDHTDKQLLNTGLGLSYFNLYYNNGLIRSMVRDSANTADLWPQTTKTSMVSPNKVHTLTLKISKNGSLFDFNYFGNGQPLLTSSKTGLKNTNNNDFRIGNDSISGESHAYIYAFRLYNRALNNEEIEKNYQIDMNRYNWRVRTNEKNN